jgi:MOSC domain-containing protein YiiM
MAKLVLPHFASKQLAPTDPRRNIVTRGVRLNELVGMTFTIGSQFAHRCGLRADVVESGNIRLGGQVVLRS